MNYAVIFAGGIGSRMGSSVPKQFLEVDGIPIIIHVVKKFSKHPDINGIIIVSKEEYVTYCTRLCEKYQIDKILEVVPGGDTGQQSIYHGIYTLYRKYSRTPEDDIVLIHDGVRPFITEQLISDSIKCTLANGNSIAASNAIETVIRVDAEGVVVDTVDRSECRNAKAPQCFFLKDLWEGHQKAISEGIHNTIDSATLMSMYGAKLHTVECSSENIKITTPNDYYMFSAVYEANKKEETK